MKNVIYIELGTHKYISETDYLKVVEEKELYKNKFEKLMNDDSYSKNIERLEKELEEKGEEIEYLKEEYNKLSVTYDKDIERKNEEMERLELVIESKNITNNGLLKMLKEKDEEIVRLERQVKIHEDQRDYWEKSSNHNYRIGNELEKENKKLKDHINVLKDLLKDQKDPKEKMWVLEYVYSDDLGLIKNIKLDPQPKEELFELIGMDSDNWTSFTMKEVE